MAQVVLLDGGMGQELIHRRGTPPSALWSAAVLADQPELVQAVHEDFIAAGAQVIIVNSYAITRPRLNRNGAGERFEELQRKALNIAKAAVGQNSAVCIAGGLSPLTGSYQPGQTLPYEECLEQYSEIVEMQSPSVDLFIAETMCTADEALAATKAIKAPQKQAWIAFTVDDKNGRLLRSGENLREVADRVIEHGADAVLVNCSSPEATDQAVSTLSGLAVPYGGYANGFKTVEPLTNSTTVDVLSAREDVTPVAYARHIMKWVADGATLVGGCCEISPAHIAEIATRLSQAGHQLVSHSPRPQKG
ncbi:MAG: homocysteine S-methyltransferase family protein [Pseudomonadota bacterium]